MSRQNFKKFSEKYLKQGTKYESKIEIIGSFPCNFSVDEILKEENIRSSTILAGSCKKRTTPTQLEVVSRASSCVLR